MKWEQMCVSKDAGGIGFRDLKDFNNALLAKKGWRIVNEPECLMARVLRARCFRNKSFFEVGCLSGSPNAIWHSIWIESEVIRNGSRRRVGDGKDTWVWKSPWLPSPENGLVSIEMNQLVGGFRVLDLILSESRSWDVVNINNLLNDRDRGLILFIKLSNIVENDGWSWTGDKSGKYSVK